MRFTTSAIVMLALGLSSASPVATNNNEARQLGCVVGLLPRLLFCASALGTCPTTTINQICACKTELLEELGQGDLDAFLSAFGNLCPATPA